MKRRKFIGLSAGLATMSTEQDPGITSHAVTHLFKDKLEIEGFGREKSRVIALKA
ncbi:MAG: hypothetical protein WEB53_17220 [Akkermansiaceae bacterium]